MSHARLIKRVASTPVGKLHDLIGIEYFLTVNSDVIEQPHRVYYLLKIAVFKIRIGLSCQGRAPELDPS